MEQRRKAGRCRHKTWHRVATRSIAWVLLARGLVLQRAGRCLVAHARLSTVSELDTAFLNNRYYAPDRGLARLVFAVLPSHDRIEVHIRRCRQLALCPAEQTSGGDKLFP